MPDLTVPAVRRRIIFNCIHEQVHKLVAFIAELNQYMCKSTSKPRSQHAQQPRSLQTSRGIHGDTGPETACIELHKHSYAANEQPKENPTPASPPWRCHSHCLPLQRTACHLHE